MAKQDAAQALASKSLLGLEAGLDVDKLTAWAQTQGLTLLSALAILLIGLWLAKWLSRALERVMTRANMEVTLRGFLRNIAYAAMMVVVVVAALQQVGVPMTSVLAVLGAAGLAIGLALKDSLSNIASGVMLIVLRPFRAGDYVQAAGVEGTVEQIRVFQTRLRTIDNRVIVLPNSLITTRFDALYGLVDLMESASRGLGDVRGPTLLMYGASVLAIYLGLYRRAQRATPRAA